MLTHNFISLLTQTHAAQSRESSRLRSRQHIKHILEVFNHSLDVMWSNARLVLTND